MRIGILVDSPEVPAWQSELVQILLDADYISTHLLLLEDTNSKSTQGDPGLLFRLYEKYERSRKKSLPDASARNQIRHLINEDEWIRIPATPICSQLSQKDSVARNLSVLQLDVILAIGGLHSVDSFCQVSKYGIWYFSHDYNQSTVTDGSTVGFWETVIRRPYIHSALIIRNKFKDNIVAYESWSGIHHKSFYQSRNEHLWKILFFVPRALKKMHRDSPEQYLSELSEKIEADRLQKSTRRYDLTDARVFLSISRCFAWRAWQKALQHLYSERWMLFVDVSGSADDISNFRLLHPPDGRFWADPHVLYDKDKYYVFYEDASVETGHGHIAVMQLDGDGTTSSPNKVLEKPYHLSYPFIFEREDQIYMIPESAANRSIELYRCINFPLQWEFVKNLMSDVYAYDATLTQHEGLWWLFTNIKQHTGASSWDELCLYYSDSPISTKWTPHPMNPIVSDVRRARPAGRLFTKDGVLFRPSQNSERRYGYALSINRINRLTTTEYSEETVETLLPDSSKSVMAIHSISRAKNLTVVDAICRSYRILKR